ncbi:hypothetical protein GOB94_09360 [Granulicella sp. 5B5]|uniref:hypothetical protein n=1 Tax=Granulicella sp. 5B5 TaxID=1617967 RepID=UPI0015F6CB89|nr:hypothetical protein [Granulicella sp. 5B5]QMV18865.1 hypothetical protein GOB94_09360 [Granulicella sp. 5B5]
MPAMAASPTFANPHRLNRNADYVFSCAVVLLLMMVVCLTRMPLAMSHPCTQW